MNQHHPKPTVITVTYTGEVAEFRFPKPKPIAGAATKAKPPAAKSNKRKGSSQTSKKNSRRGP